MFRSLTLLIVLAIAGAPIAPLACDVWCAGPAAQEHHRSVNCHGGSGASADPREMVAANAGCHVEDAATVFLADGRNHVPTPAAATVSDNPALAPQRDGGSTPGWALVVTLSFSRTPLRDVLRL